MLRRSFTLGLLPGCSPALSRSRRNRRRAGQDHHRLRRRLDEERARRRQRGLHQGDRHQGRGELCGKLRAGEADRSRARRPTCSSPPISNWMDYVRAEEADQGRHARQPARQQAGADRAEGFQDRQCHASARASISPSSPATAASRPATCARCRSATMPRRRWRSSAPGPRREPKLAMAENVRAALALVVARRGGARHRLRDRRQGRAGREDRRRVSRTDSHPPIIYPVARPTRAKPDGDRLSRVPARARSHRTIFEKYGFTFLAAKPST